MISPVLEDIFFWNFLETFRECWHTNSKWIWISCLSVSLLFGLLLYWNHTNIDNSSSGWYIFLKFLGDTLGTLIHYFQIILIFCMSVSLLVGILLKKTDKSRNIFSSEWDIFLNVYGGTWMLLYLFEGVVMSNWNNHITVLSGWEWLYSLDFLRATCWDLRSIRCLMF